GRFVDYTELDAASNRGVQEVQSLLEQAVYKPVQGRFKVFMIDEVHMLSNHAFNAMLKTLEEPPEYLKFVLATTDPQKVPATVLSRCLQFNLRPMAPETLLDHLSHVLAAEQVEADAQALRLIARAARGSMRDALSLTDQAIAFNNGALPEAGVRQMLGSVDRQHVFGLIGALAAGAGRSVVDTVDALRTEGLSAASTLEEMTGVLQAMAVLQAVPDLAKQDAAGGADPDAAETARLATLLPPDETQLLYSLCLHGRAELGLAPDEYAGLVMVLLRLLAFKPPVAQSADMASSPPTSSSPSSSALSPSPALTSEPERRAVAVAAPTPPVAVPEPVRVPAPAPAPAEATVDTDRPAGAPGDRLPPPSAGECGDVWQALVAQMISSDAITALTRELALQSQLVTQDAHCWLLRLERASLNTPVQRERLQAALAAAGHPVRLQIETGSISDSPALRLAHAAAERQRAAEDVIHGDPLVQSLMRDFGARIVPGSLRPE
ncbi:MAG: DNA polymerase III subunit gamma/tau, partial [Variovorax sp.]